MGRKNLLSAYKKYSRKPDTDNRLIEKFNTQNDTLLLIKKGTWFKGDDSEIDNLKWTEGSQSIYKKWLSHQLSISKK